MQPTQTQSIAHVGDDTEDVGMSIDQSALTHLMSILTDLYSDPQLAILREYSTNAWDSHVEAGHRQPIRVTLPTLDKPTLVIQDFGIGLSVGDLKRNYSMYGSSTKRQSDELNGMLGIGCKSGLTYAIQFNVVGIKGGIKTVAMVTKDEDGVGVIKVLDTVGTDEPDGVKVSIPIKPGDVVSVRSKAFDFYQWWREGVELGGEDELTALSDGLLWIDDDVAIVPNFDPHGRRNNYEDSASYIIMGNVAYPIENQYVDFEYPFYAWVPIGAVQFTPSREALHYTDKTKETIKEIQEFAKERLAQKIKTEIDAAETPWAKAALFARWVGVASAPYGSGSDGMDRKWMLSKRLDVETVVHYCNLPNDRPAWQFGARQNHNSQWSSQCSKNENYLRWRDISSETTWIVTGFPFKSVSQVHRSRFIQHGITNALVVPDAAPHGDLFHGRKNVISFDKLLELYPTPPRVKGQPSQSKDTFTYDVRKGNTISHVPRIDKPGEVILYSTRGRTAFMPQRPNDRYPLWWLVFPDVNFVEIQQRQVDKFLRLHPKAVKAEEYLLRQQAKAKRRLTDADHYKAHMLSWIHQFESHKARLDDPELRRLIDIRTQKSATLDAARNLGVGPTDTHPRLLEINQFYPLVMGSLNGNYGADRDAVIEDLIDYLNYKYNKAQEALKP